MSRIGFIGLGVMGTPMAAHLAAAGHEVSGFDLNADALAKLEAAGGRAAKDVADAVSGAEVVITMLPNHPQVEQVVLAPGGVLDTIAPGTLLADMSTIRPETSIEVAKAGAAKGIRVLDAPVSGG
ncbi:NAD(P)-binding domain-containing protein, partial [Amycolatopsis sp. NPDC000673]